MLIFTWLILITPLQTQELHDVFVSAFLPQGRSTASILNDYFLTKVVPRLENDPLLLVVCDDERIIAFVFFEHWQEKSYYLAEMAVLPEYQRQGLGRKLVFSIFDQDPLAETILLITDKDNKWARSFYEAIGFRNSSFRYSNYPENFVGYEFSRGVLDLFTP